MLPYVFVSLVTNATGQLNWQKVRTATINLSAGLNLNLAELTDKTSLVMIELIFLRLYI